MMERVKSRKLILFLVAAATMLLLPAFVENAADADSEPPFIVLWGESDIKAVTYHPESGQYCVETKTGSISCGCKCIIDDTCDEEEKVLEEDTPTPGITPGPSPTPTKEPTETPEPTPTVVPTVTPGITPEPSPTPTIEPTPTEEPSQPQNCNNGLGNGPDCPPPGHDKDGNGEADGPKGDNDDDDENRPCGEPGNPCNNNRR